MLELKSLGLSYNKIGDEGAISFAEMLRNNNTLENLSLSGNQISTKGGETLIASLCQNNSLSTLLLSQVSSHPNNVIIFILCNTEEPTR